MDLAQALGVVTFLEAKVVPVYATFAGNRAVTSNTVVRFIAVNSLVQTVLGCLHKKGVGRYQQLATDPVFNTGGII